jgi:hypothetical protein
VWAFLKPKFCSFYPKIWRTHNLKQLLDTYDKADNDEPLSLSDDEMQMIDDDFARYTMAGHGVLYFRKKDLETILASFTLEWDD